MRQVPAEERFTTARGLSCRQQRRSTPRGAEERQAASPPAVSRAGERVAFGGLGLLLVAGGIYSDSNGGQWFVPSCSACWCSRQPYDVYVTERHPTVVTIEPGS
jgi:hypothetical protein